MKRDRGIEAIPWLTAEGTLDLAGFPLDSLLKETLSAQFDRFRSGCVLLGSMAGGGRAEAGVYLVGLMRYYASDLTRLTVVVEQLAHFPHASSAEALLAELRRVKSSNATRRYLNQVLRSVTRFPRHLVSGGLQDLAYDTFFSSKMRAKFLDALETIERW
jgi:hypothetical protein